MTTKRMEKQQKPQSCSRNTSSPRLWTVELDPATTLREQDLPVVGRDRVRLGVADELCLVKRKVLEEEGREVPIFSEMEEVLHVEGVDAVLGVVMDKLIGDQEWLVGVWGAEAVESEATG
jgi:hypothetical protein